MPLPAEPSFPMPADTAEQKPTTAAGRIERRQTQLLDLLLRNRLLNFSDSKRTVSFVCPDIAYLRCIARGWLERQAVVRFGGCITDSSRTLLLSEIAAKIHRPRHYIGLLDRRFSAIFGRLR
jgi:hypothetical protein